MEIDPATSDKDIGKELKRELERLEDLVKLRSLGVRLAVKSAELIEERLMEKGEGRAALRDVNRSLEIVTKTAILADSALTRSSTATVEANTPRRNVVLFILESTIPDERKRAILVALADEMGDQGRQLVYEAIVDASDSKRASELLELEA
jgi:hypothetical protein